MGALRFPFSTNSPGVGLEANWLPAPSGAFFVVMRLYWPKPVAIDGRWTAPPLLREGAPGMADTNGVVSVTPDNFARAESALHFGNFVKDGGLAKFIDR